VALDLPRLNVFFCALALAMDEEDTLNRRKFLASAAAGTASALIERVPDVFAESTNSRSRFKSAEMLFPAKHLPELTWTQFHASGFTGTVCGMLHSKRKPAECGMPLGTIGTGCLDLETDGTFGYCSIFSSFVPPRGKLRAPFLGLRIGERTWTLATSYTDELEAVNSPTDIHYWGHYPIADLEYETTAPVEVGLRAWTPFIPGDVAISNAPGAVFEVRLRNKTQFRQKGSLLFSFPGPTQAEAQISSKSPRAKVQYNWYTVQVPLAKGAVPAKRQVLTGEIKGVRVSSDTGVEYTLGALVDDASSVHIGGPYTAGKAWSTGITPKALDDDFGSSLTINFDLGPAESTNIRIVLAWFAPLWKGEGDHHFTPMYTTRYSDSLAVANLLARNHELLLQRILNWQQVVYSEETLPIWLRDSLVNNLHLITEVSLWATAKSPIGEWCRPSDGLFAMNESPRECPQMECIPCSFYGNIPVVYFFPELALSTLRGYKAYQFPDGAAPWNFGGITSNPPAEGTEMALPSRGSQTTTNGISYADMVDKYWLRTGDQGFLKEFYPSVKNNMIYTMNLNTGPDGVISMPSGNIDPANGGHVLLEWVEGEEWAGMTSHVAGLHLVQLRIVERLAREVNDREFAEQCRHWYAQGSRSLEGKLWNNGYYLAYLEPETGKRSNRIFSCQLDGDWIAAFHGLPPIFQKDRAQRTLATITANNSKLAPWGTVFFANPDGTPWLEAGYGPFAMFVAEQLMLAMTYIYAGEKNIGLEEAHRCIHNLMVKGYTWNQPCIVQAKTGERINGYDYYQNMMLWSMPAALLGKDLRSPCISNGLIDLILRAAARTGN
jgi:uncharacterized protein (DUF608 family)